MKKFIAMHCFLQCALHLWPDAVIPMEQMEVGMLLPKAAHRLRLRMNLIGRISVPKVR